ncbi:thioredoxin family protein [Alteromonas sp. C1M14]|uniref:TlpA family protein disulfide reductase n=1 Tax=Alteromonas sp. C1M14 TaxID=2841567 RepID=UPI001C094AA7|nr:thioredoxin family protein [Alteromonas sp. C1M14]MBU2978816.1 thioredoxin family protein [Alteromonas sp. C1M14]
MQKSYSMLGVILLLVTIVSACSYSRANQQQAADDAVGEISQQQLLTHYPVFSNNYNAYSPSDKEVAAVASLQGYSLVVLFGTWCHDSEREVPRLLKTLDASGLDNLDIQLVAVDRKKRDPQGIALSHKLKYTPTFVLLKDGKELGRVIEKPTLTISQDLQAIAAQTTP